MARTLELGRPASHARLLARRALLRASVAGLVAAALVSGVLLLHLQLPKAVALVAAGASFVLALKLLGAPYHRARAGVRSEVRVAKALRKANPAALIHGAVLGQRGGDADHIVLGRCAAMVETKTGRGQVQVGADGSVVANGRRMPKNPIRQAQLQADRVAKATGLHVTAIVCVVDMANPPMTTDSGVVVCSASDLPKVLGSLPKVVDAKSAQMAARVLHERSES